MRVLEDITKILKDEQDTISSLYRAHIVGIFGSYAKGLQEPASDIDILVRFDDGATLFDLVGLGIYLEEVLQMKVDVVSERGLRAELKDKILEEIVAI